MKTIEKIYIKYLPDESPDLSWIGEYSDKAKEGAIDHRERTGQGYKVYQYFNPANPEYAEKEYEYMEQIENGHVSIIGIVAYAEIRINGVFQKIQSGGLWGIEYTGNEKDNYLKDIENEQVHELYETLLELGFKSKAICKIEVEKKEY